MSLLKYPPHKICIESPIMVRNVQVKSICPLYQVWPVALYGFKVVILAGKLKIFERGFILTVKEADFANNHFSLLSAPTIFSQEPWAEFTISLLLIFFFFWIQLLFVSHLI